MDEEELLNNPQVQAMLNVIRKAEGADYNTRVGGSKFQDLSKKPGKKTYIKSINNYSTAEGAYQFLNSTWEAVSKKLGLKDFSPKSQDLGAIELIKRRGALEDVLNGNFETAVNKLSKEWASLPTAQGRGAYRGQKARKMDYLKSIYNQPIIEATSPQETEEEKPIISIFSDKLPTTEGITFQEEKEAEVPQKQEEEQSSQKLLQENFLEEQLQQQQLQPQPQEQESFTPQYEVELQPIEYQPIVPEQYKDGGQIPISSEGMYKYPNQMVIVPTDNGVITMNGINYPVFGVDEFGNSQIMYPNQNYKFQGKNILEVPIIKV